MKVTIKLFAYFRDSRFKIAHRDLEDERLILLQGGNKQVWQGSYSQLPADRSQLLESDGSVFLLSLNNENYFDKISLYFIDFEQSELIGLLESATDSAISSTIQAFPISDELILIYAGNGLVALNPVEAEAILYKMRLAP